MNYEHLGFCDARGGAGFIVGPSESPRFENRRCCPQCVQQAGGWSRQ